MGRNHHLEAQVHKHRKLDLAQGLWRDKQALLDDLEELEESTDQQIEFDVIAICCEYSEQSPLAIAGEYAVDTAGLNDDEIRDAVLAFLHDETIVVGVTERGSIIYCSAF